MRFINDCFDYVPHNGEYGVAKDFVTSKIRPKAYIRIDLAFAIYGVYMKEVKDENTLSRIRFTSAMKQSELQLRECAGGVGTNGHDCLGELQLKREWIENHRKHPSQELYNVFEKEAAKYNSIAEIGRVCSGMKKDVDYDVVYGNIVWRQEYVIPKDEGSQQKLEEQGELLTDGNEY